MRKYTQNIREVHEATFQTDALVFLRVTSRLYRSLGKSQHHCMTRFVFGMVLLFGAALNLWGNGFPLGYHFDEEKKVRFLATGAQDFHHPLLMLQVARVANAVCGVEDARGAAVVGRSTTALAGVAVVLAVFLLARRQVGDRVALFFALATAVCPLLVVHAHYFKEDVLFTACALLALDAYLRFLDRPAFRSAVVLGLWTGLSGATHYKAALLIPLFLLFPWVISLDRRKWCYAWGLAAIAIAADVFLVVNYPILDDPATFLRGMAHEAEHVLRGHDGIISASSQSFAFHWRESLIPGMTRPTALLGLAGLVGAAVQWKSLSRQDRLLAAFAVLYYLVPELSPTKPPPDFCRYMLPVAVVLVYFACRTVVALWNASAHSVARWGAGCLGFAAVAVPFYDTLLLDYHFDRDTRERAAHWVQERGGQAVFGRYAAPWHVGSARPVQLDLLRLTGVDYVVVSSFQYDRYFLVGELPGQPESVYRHYREFQRLFEFPYVEFRPAHRSFAFTNPVIRVVDIQAGLQIQDSP